MADHTLNDNTLATTDSATDVDTEQTRPRNENLCLLYTSDAADDTASV